MSVRKTEIDVLVHDFHGITHIVHIPRKRSKPFSSLRRNSQRVWLRRKLGALYPDYEIREIFLREAWPCWDFKGCDAKTFALPPHPRFSTILER